MPKLDEDERYLILAAREEALRKRPVDRRQRMSRPRKPRPKGKICESFAPSRDLTVEELLNEF